MLGAVGGAVLLLTLPSAAFDAIVPVLIVLALVLVVFGKRMTAWLTRRGRAPGEHIGPALWLATLGCGVYGGYFGAAQGVLMMGLFGLLLAEDLQRQNALKNVLTGLVNLVAAVVFVITAHIDWAAAGLVAAGSIVGGVLGARVGRRLSPTVLRGVIVVVGIAAIVKLLFFSDAVEFAAPRQREPRSHGRVTGGVQRFSSSGRRRRCCVSGAFTLLTDPNFLHRGQRAYLGYGLHLPPPDRSGPATSTSCLDLDAIVLSHMHGDHWDRVAKRGLNRSTPDRHDPEGGPRAGPARLRERSAG